LDHTGQPYIAYCARDYSGQFCLKLAHRINATWDIQCAIVGTNYAGMADVSLALDSSDQPHISYIDMATSSIEYVRRTEVGWQSYTVDDTTTIDARTSTLALDRLGQPHISYYHGGDRVFKHAQPDLDAWLTQPVDQGWLVGLYPSLAIGQDGVFHVSYHDAVNSSSDLKYAHRGTDVWDVQIVDSVGRVGMFSSLVLNGFGQPVISYYDETRGDLKVANKRAGAWNTNAVDQDGNVGLYTSLAVDNQGRFHISYYDKTNGDLKYAIGLPLASRTYLPIIRR
jgi:hypothetical protein